MTSVNTNLQQDYNPQGPPEHTHTLQDEPDKHHVKPAPGGTIQIQAAPPQDGIASIPDNVGRRESGTSVLKSDPKTHSPLLERSYTPQNPEADTEAKATLQLLFGFFLPTQQKSEPFDLDFVRSGSSIDGETSFEDIEKNMQSGTHVTTPPVGYDLSSSTLGQVVNTVLNSPINLTGLPPKELLKAIVTTGSPLSTNAAQTNALLASTDPTAVLIAITGMVNWEKIPPSEVANVKEQIEILAKLLSSGNKEGGVAGMQSSSAGATLLTISLLLKPTASGKSESTKEAFGLALTDIAQSIAKTRLTLLDAPEQSSAEFTALNGQDLSDAKNAIALLLASLPESKTLPKGLLESISNTLAEQLLEKNKNGELYDIRSDDPAVIAALLTSILQQAGFTQNIQDIVPGLSGKIAAMNTSQLNTQMRSSDSNVVHDAMIQKVGLHHVPQSDTKAFIGDYLKVLSMVLSFMSQIRSKIIQMEGVLSREQAAARIASINDQIKIASQKYTIAVEKIASSFTGTVDKLVQAAFWKIFAPVVALVIAIVVVVMCIIAVALAISAIFTGGATIPLVIGLIAAIAGLVIAAIACITAAVSVVTIIACNKTLDDMVLDAMHVTDPVARAAISLSIDLIAMVLITVLTLGAATAVMIGAAVVKVAVSAAMGVAKAVLSVFVKALGEIIKQAYKALEKMFLAMFMQMLTSVLSSPLIYQGIYQASLAIRTARGESKENAEKAAALDALITSFVVGGVAMIGSGTVMSGVKIAQGAKAAGKTIGAGFKELGNLINMPMHTMGKWMTSIEKTIKSGIDKFLNMFTKPYYALFKGTTADTTTVGMSTTAAGAAISTQSPGKYMLRVALNAIKCIGQLGIDHHQDILRSIQPVLTIIASIIQAESARTEAEYMKSMSKMTYDLASINAVMNALRAISKDSFNITMDSMKEAAEEANEQWMSLVKLVASFIEGASGMVSRFEQVAGR